MYKHNITDTFKKALMPYTIAEKMKASKARHLEKLDTYRIRAGGRYVQPSEYM